MRKLIQQRIADNELIIDDLYHEIQRVRGKLKDLYTVIEESDKCPCGGTDIYHEDNRGWCEDCGRVYVYSDYDVIWFVPDSARLKRRVEEQKKWISLCGGDLDGYIKKYGVPGTIKCSGNGGAAIYEADMNELKRLQDELLHFWLGEQLKEGEYASRG